MPLQGRRLAAAAGYRRLFAEGEGEGEGSNIQSFGCFPDFYYPQDFDDWIQGHFKGNFLWGPVPVGIVCASEWHVL